MKNERRTMNALEGVCSLRKLADCISNGDFENIIVMCGAGISVSCGIPDFRTPGTGLYDNLERFNLPSPHHVFDLNYFKQTHGKAFYSLAKEMWPDNFNPSPAHAFIKLLSDRKILLRCYTQNIDTLERLCGIDPDLIVEAHGSFSSASCTKCLEPFPIEKCREIIINDESPVLCENCKGLVKPGIVFFGESLPDSFGILSKDDLKQCDLLIIMGTSLSVFPFASLVDMAGSSIPRLLINNTAVGVRTPFNSNGLRLFQEDNFRDVFLRGSIDDGVRALCDLIGNEWRKDLEQIAHSVGSIAKLANFYPNQEATEINEIEWAECFPTMSPEFENFNQRFCHSMDHNDFPEISILEQSLEISENDPVDLLNKDLQNMSLKASGDKEVRLVVEKESIVLLLKGSMQVDWDEDDYAVIVPQGTKALKRKDFIEFHSLHAPKKTGVSHLHYIKTRRLGTKTELWYVHNESGKVKARFSLHKKASST